MEILLHPPNPNTLHFGLFLLFCFYLCFLLTFCPTHLGIGLLISASFLPQIKGSPTFAFTTSNFFYIILLLELLFYANITNRIWENSSGFRTNTIQCGEIQSISKMVTTNALLLYFSAFRHSSTLFHHVPLHNFFFTPSID